MKFNATVVPTGRGQYGPFENGRFIAYLDFADPDGGGSDRATAGEGVNLEEVDLFQPVELSFEMYLGGQDGRSRKLRTFGPSSSSGRVRSAA